MLVDPNRLDYIVRIETYLSTEIRKRLIGFLKEMIHFFSWDTSDMSGINPKVITHKLNFDPSFKPVREKRIRFAPKKNQDINEEVGKLYKNKME